VTRTRAVLALGVALGVCGPVAAQEPAPGQAFDHSRHRRVLPTCVACHQGAEDPDAAIWPDSAACATCHDGTVRPTVPWRPPEGPRPSNQRFLHDLVPLMVRPAAGQPDPPACVDCHQEKDAPWMAVRRTVLERCLECHGVRVAHLAAPDTACASCHLPLVEATDLPRERIAGWPAPPSHREPGFTRSGEGGHGRAATSGVSGAPIAASCATCHARDFCITCHVDAPEQRAIQALEPDPRSTAIATRLMPPESHGDPAFLSRHGAIVRRTPAACATCHTQESCATCHAAAPRLAAALHAGGAGRGVGAQPTRRPPSSHRDRFAERHAVAATSVPASCAGCHVRTDCLSCHRPDAGAASGFHPAGFLTRHPAAAYARETSCSDCHSAQAFCATCHQSAGLTATRTLGSGFHDASTFFIAGHGTAARQSLESCVACHTEGDCLKCHSALGGRHFSPHGPGFDPERLRRKNPEMCVACHGRAIQGR
jgi:hypothetical protein